MSTSTSGAGQKSSSNGELLDSATRLLHSVLSRRNKTHPHVPPDYETKTLHDNNTSDARQTPTHLDDSTDSTDYYTRHWRDWATFPLHKALLPRLPTDAPHHARTTRAGREWDGKERATKIAKHGHCGRRRQTISDVGKRTSTFLHALSA